MIPTSLSTIDTALARGVVYRCLAQALHLPGEAFGTTLTQGLWLAALQEAVEALTASDMLLDSLAALEIVQPATELAALQREYTRLFSNMTLTDFPPYGAEYLASHIFMKAQSMADVAGFYRAFGVDIDAGTERPDHISVELAFMGYLCWKEAYAAEHELGEALDITIAAQKRFFADHLGRWAARFLRRFETATVQPFYRALAAFGQVFLAMEEAQLGILPDMIPDLPPEPPLHGAFICGADDDQCPLKVATSFADHRG